MEMRNTKSKEWLSLKGMNGERKKEEERKRDREEERN